jgi:hypothetical protein
MSKSLLQEKHLNEIIYRLDAISQDAQPLWGKMEVSEMMLHCTQILDAVINSTAKSGTTTWKHVLAKYIFLYVKKDFPKMVKGPKRFDTKGKTSTQDFEILKQNLVKSLSSLKNLNTKLSGFHPFFGKLSHKEWGIMLYKHTHHHFKQFGI